MRIFYIFYTLSFIRSNGVLTLHINNKNKSKWIGKSMNFGNDPLHNFNINDKNNNIVELFVKYIKKK